MLGWVKHFKDGQSEVGSDDLVEAKQASWKHGRQEGMVAVDLHWDNKRYTLSCGEGEYWQSDTMIAMFSPGQTVPGHMLTRRISRQLNEGDVGKKVKIVQHGENFTAIYLLTDEEDESEYTPALVVSQEHVGKWLTFELNAENATYKLTLQSTRK